MMGPFAARKRRYGEIVLIRGVNNWWIKSCIDEMILGELKNELYIRVFILFSIFLFFYIDKCRNAVRAIPYRNQRTDTVSYRCHGFIYGHRISFFFGYSKDVLVRLFVSSDPTHNRKCVPKSKKTTTTENTADMTRQISLPCFYVYTFIPLVFIIDDAWERW